MKIVAVPPVPFYATYDVYRGQVKALKTLGAEVIEVPYGKIWNRYSDFGEWMVVTSRALYGTLNINKMAAMHVIAGVLEQLPDLVYIVAPMHFFLPTIDALANLRKLGVKVAVCFTESPYDDDSWQLGFAEHIDFAFVMDRISLPRFHERNSQSFYLGHAYDPEIHYPGDDERDIEAIMVTTLFPSRKAFLEAVEWDGLDLQIYGVAPVGRNSSLRPFVKVNKAMANEIVAQLYRRSQLGIQLHRQDRITGRELVEAMARGDTGILGAVADPSLKGHSLGPRSYELAGCGVCQVSDAERPELTEVFDGSVPTFQTPEDLSAILRQLRDDPVRRQKYASEQQIAVRPYTFERRMRTVLEAVT